MPLDDRDAYWGRSHLMSSAHLGDLRRRWAAAGRDAWNAATRAGRNVVARTERELEALGRAQLEAERQSREYEGAVARQRAVDVAGVLGARDALPALYRNHRDMVEADWIGADKYFHCKGNCEAAQEGRFSAASAGRLGNAREVYGQRKGDPAADMLADQDANRFGRLQGTMEPEGQCSALCARYRPHGLPSRY